MLDFYFLGKDEVGGSNPPSSSNNKTSTKVEVFLVFGRFPNILGVFCSGFGGLYLARDLQKHTKNYIKLNIKFVVNS